MEKSNIRRNQIFTLVAPKRSDIPASAGIHLRRAFTLVELSIVLVILGLLVGGVLAGQSLIRAAELRAVTTEYQRYIAAVHSFRDKYFALPGDMANASSFWTTLIAGNNGNGNGGLDAPVAANATGEIFQFWNELALAGLIEGTYTGLAGSGASIDSLPGTNVPRSKISNAGWSVYNHGNYAGDTAAYAYNYGNIFSFGVRASGTITLAPALKPEEAWNIDTKMDDGRPASGKVMIREYNGWAAAAANKCTTSTSNTDYAGLYNLSGTAVACTFYFPSPF